MIEFDNKSVGEIIRKFRMEKGLSQEVLSGLTGMARSHLSMIETGTKKANFETIWRIANALGIAPSELVHQIELRSSCKLQKPPL